MVNSSASVEMTRKELSRLIDINNERNVDTNNAKDAESESDSESSDEDEFQPLISQDRAHNVHLPPKHHSNHNVTHTGMHDDYSASADEHIDDETRTRTALGKRKARVLSMALCALLLNFWMLDSIKDPVLEILSNGDLQRCQPQAKMASVFSTLTLVCLMEFISQERKRQQQHKALMNGDEAHMSTNISTALFYVVGLPYCVVFLVLSLALRQHPALQQVVQQQQHQEDNMDVNMDIDIDIDIDINIDIDDTTDPSIWKILGFVQYVAIESYGSIGVAAFWSFTNSRLDLISAEQHYGLIIAVAQVGAIIGATLSMSFGKVSANIPKLFAWSAVMVLVTIGIMKLFDIMFPDNNNNNDEHGGGGEELTDVYAVAYRREIDRKGALLMRPNTHTHASTSRSSSFTSNSNSNSNSNQHRQQQQKSKRNNFANHANKSSSSSSLMSGVYLILKHKYLIYILGVSCLYEVALTCLDYEMKLVGLAKFQLAAAAASTSTATSATAASTSSTSSSTSIDGTFASFMGHFGQLTNVLSLLLSYFGFPYLMKHVGLRQTLPLFPSVLLCATVLIFAMTPNLWLIFICLALLKAMTYSINEPAKEILYMPTSNTIKLKAKFWIDVVGSRCAKALGSSITNYAGSADRLVTFGAVPSIMTGLILLAVSVRAGDEFDQLVQNEQVIGLEEELMESNTFRNQYQEVYLHDDDSELLSRDDDYEDDEYDDDEYDDDEYDDEMLFAPVLGA
jgi:hypothetical protein